jgi:hypothetical protein
MDGKLPFETGHLVRRRCRYGQLMRPGFSPIFAICRVVSRSRFRMLVNRRIPPPIMIMFRGAEMQLWPASPPRPKSIPAVFVWARSKRYRTHSRDFRYIAVRTPGRHHKQCLPEQLAEIGFEADVLRELRLAKSTGLDCGAVRQLPNLCRYLPRNVLMLVEREEMLAIDATLGVRLRAA